MGTWSTPINNTGRVIDGQKLVNLQNYITRTAGVFGISVTGTKVPTAPDPINIDAVRIQIEHLVKTAKNGNRYDGNIMKFVALANSAGVGLSIGPSVVSGVSGLAVSNETQITADVDWDAYVPEDAGTVLYDLEFYDTDANPDELELSLTDQPYGTINPDLHTQTNYKVRIRATWNGGASSTPWSAFETFVTLDADVPDNLVASNESQVAADLDWDAALVESFDITYDVEVRRVSDNALEDSVSDQVGLSFTPDLHTQTDYKARVRVRWTDDGIERTGPWSNYTNFSTLAADVPANLAISNEAEIGADADWDPAVVEAFDISYDIEFRRVSDDVLVDSSIDQVGLSYTAVLNTFTDYKARVRTKWTDGEGEKTSAWSGYVNFSTLNTAAPTGLAVSNETATTADLDWDAKVIEAYGILYDVEVREQAGDALIFSSYDQADISVQATGLTTATNYYAKVRAQWTDAEGIKNTAYSSNVRFTTS